MSKRTTKRDVILEEAREWVKQAEYEVKEKEIALAESRARLEAHQAICFMLEQSLAPQPRQSSATSRPMKKRSDTVTLTRVITEGDICSRPDCEFRYDDKVHHVTAYPGYHVFVHADDRRAKKSSSKSTRKPGKKRATAATDTDWRTPCAKEGCELTADSAIHNLNSGYLGVHPFVSPAPTATQPSSTNGAETPPTLNSVDETVSAQSAAGGLNGD